MAGVEDLDPELAELMGLEEAEPALAAANLSVARNDDRQPRLRQLAQLRNLGVITNEVFEAEKARIFSDWVPH